MNTHKDNEETLNVAMIYNESYVDGDGIRYAIYVQGCAHGCLGCHNQETWPFTPKNIIKIDEIIEQIVGNPYLDGITISGGDPFYQPIGVNTLITKLKQRLIDMNRDLSEFTIWCYTGYTIDELITSGTPEQKRLLSNIDILVDGPYKQSERDLTLEFRGSKNQRVIDVGYTLLNYPNIKVIY